MSKPINLETIEQEIKIFRQQQQTIIMATLAAENMPEVSYAPFIWGSNEACYVLLSNLASHSKNLHSHQQLSILFIEDEQQCRNIFARKRLTYQCQAGVMARTAPDWQTVVRQLQNKFGKTVELLAGMDDFNLYCLQPVSGTYVRGFGQAYAIEGNTIVHQNPSR